MARPETLRSTVGRAADVPRKVTVSMEGEYKRLEHQPQQQSFTLTTPGFMYLSGCSRRSFSSAVSEADRSRRLAYITVSDAIRPSVPSPRLMRQGDARPDGVG